MNLLIPRGCFYGHFIYPLGNAVEMSSFIREGGTFCKLQFISVRKAEDRKLRGQCAGEPDSKTSVCQSELCMLFS